MGRRGGIILAILFAAAALTGCSAPTKGPVVFYLEGAGWFGSSGSVEAGLRDAGYTGQFHNFSWTAYLGPAQDHFVNAQSKVIAKRLAQQIEGVRRNDPNGEINVMGLSAGTAVILNALQQLGGGVMVDNVVLFSPSVSSQHNLNKAMSHVKRNLYATSSSHDGILSGLSVNADGQGGPPAGTRGFSLPGGEKARAAYERVVLLPWRPSYIGYGWTGSHTSVTSRQFVASIIAPRILTKEPFPLDRPMIVQTATKELGEIH